MAGACAPDLVSKLGEYLIPPIGRQFGYVLRYKTYVEGLETEVKLLEAARDRVQGSANEARYDGKLIYPDVEDWLESVAKKVEEAQDLLERGKHGKSACFRGWIPNPVVRYPIGKKVSKMTEVIQGLHKTSTDSTFQKLYYEKTPIGIVTAPTFAARSIDNNEDVLQSRASIAEDVLQSRASIAEDVIKSIANDKMCVAGVFGPGGVGKSKLLENIKRRVTEEKLFDVVVMANVSRNPDLKIIQAEIAYALGLKLTNDEPASVRAYRLCERLKSDPKKNILIILDNLWEKLELKEVGIPCGEDNKVRGCKLLLTSRYRRVLLIDMCSDQEFRLKELEYGEARRLFERTVGHRINDPEIKPLVDGVVKNGGGLPLLIVPLAKRLKHGALAEWRKALTNIEGSDIKSIVELNYNDLKEERIRSLFLVCALDSGSSYLRDTLIYCMGLGLFKNFSMTIENARDTLIVDLHSLQDSSLLLDSDDMEVFRMHDKFVDVAISISSTDWYALVGKKDYGFKKWSKNDLRKCTAIAFNFVGIDEIPENLDCPNLRILVLCEHNPSLKISNSFFESMEKLQVLDITGLSFTSLPSSIEFLENLKSLCLDQCHMEDVTVVGKMKGLQFLSFSDSTITQLPREIGGLTELRFLDLTGCTRLKVIEPGVLESLVNLEELSMEDSFDHWEAEDEVPRNNASLAELKNMKKLSTLSIAIPHSFNLSIDLPFGKLNKHKIQIGNVWDWSSEYKESRTLKLELDSDNLLLEDWVQRCLQRTQDLHLDGLQDGNDSIHDLCIKDFQELKHLHIRNSPSFQYIVHSTENVQCIAFTRLELLFLENLKNLEKICHGYLGQESFSKLKIVKVDNCAKIKHLFSLSTKTIFLQVEEIEIKRCQLMQQIVADAKVDEDGDEIDDDPKVKACNLHRLTLRNLPEMTSFCKTGDHLVVFFDGQQVSLPRLESLTLSQLPKLKEIWNSHFPTDVSNLKFLKVEDCTFVLSIIPSSLLIKLQNLETIEVKGCQLIQEVFDLEGLTANEILSRLTKLTLNDLPSLARIWNKIPRRALCFRNLRILKVQNCENLRFLFSSSMVKALTQIKEIEIVSCELMEEIMDVQEEESEEAATTDILEFPQLTSLSLQELSNLRTFSCRNYRIHYPSLTRLLISGCPKMMTFSLFERQQQSTAADTSLQRPFDRVNPGLSLPAFFNQNVLFPSLEELTLLSLRGMQRIWHNELPEKSFCKLASITVKDCENLSHIFPSTLIERFERVEMIEVVKCTSLEALMEHVNVDTKKRQKPLVFLGLKEVKLWDLPGLNTLVTSSIKATLGLPSLTNVSLGYCDGLRYLFTNDTARTLDKLEMLDISGCNNMQEVVAVEEGEERKLKAVKFSHLRTLKLCSLKSLISFSSGSCAYVFPSLKEFTVEDCQAVEVIVGDASCRKREGGIPTQQSLLLVEKVGFPDMESMKISHMDNVKKIWLDELSSNAFGKLKTLIVEYCEKLSSIFASNTILARFQNLEKLTVTNCGSLEVVFQVGEFNFSKAHSTSTFQLRELVLTMLPKMKHVWSGLSQGALTFRCLRSLEASNCESLKSLFPCSVAKSMTQLENLIVMVCGVEEIIVEEDGGVGTSASDPFFPRLTNLYLYGLPKLRSFYRNSHTSTWPLLKTMKVACCPKIRLFSFACEIQSCQGTSTNENQLALFSVEKVIPQLEQLTLGPKEVAMLRQHYIFGNLRRLDLMYFYDENVAFLFSFLLKRFPNLEELVVCSSSFEDKLPEDEFGHGGATPCGEFTDMEKPLMTLGKLKQLTLLKLDKLKRVWRDGSLTTKILQQIESLFVLDCPNLSILLPSPNSFQRLTRLEVRNCAGLVHMGTCSSVTSLVHLTLLFLINCDAMEDVVTDDGNGVEEISFPKLRQLTLEGLPSLESFSPTNCAYKFPSLVHIIVKQCPKMNIFCKGDLWTPNLDKVLLSYEDDEGRWEGDLNTTIQTLST